MDFLTSDHARWLVAVVCHSGRSLWQFSNVVVYRLPAGMGISWPGSHCPKCKHAIRWYDNVPVLGWLWLRGVSRLRPNYLGPLPAGRG